MSSRIFSVQAEIEKLQYIFRSIKKAWKNKPDLSVEFKDFKDPNPAGETIDNYMKDLLFGNNFRNFTLFVAFIKSPGITFWITISENDDNSWLRSVIHVYFDSKEGGPHLDDEVDIQSLRDIIWNVYDFFNTDRDVKSNAEEEFESLLLG